MLLRHVPPALAYALRQLPLLLSDDAPGLRSRVASSPYPDDDEESRQWSRHATPELEHLFVSARQVVLTDLLGLCPDGSRGDHRIEIPATHVTAWLSALGAARVGLGEAYRVEARDMSQPRTEEIRGERDRAILLIHLLGWMQALLVDSTENDE
ncbi:MAG: DUF2017 family protein [Planctomycetota bacterium]